MWGFEITLYDQDGEVIGGTARRITDEEYSNPVIRQHVEDSVQQDLADLLESGEYRTTDTKTEWVHHVDPDTPTTETLESV